MDISVLSRTPPNNIEAEQSVLGCMILDNEVIAKVLETIHTDDFYREDHREIFSALLDLFDKGLPTDAIALSDKLLSRGTLDKIGGLEYLNTLSNIVPSITSVGYYMTIVEEKSVLRKLIKAASEIVDMGYEASEDVTFILDRAEQGIFEIAKEKSKSGVLHIKDVLMDTINRLEELYKQDGYLTGIPTGFSDIDRKLSGLQNSDLILIAARPAMGKTSLALNIAQYAAVHANVPVAVFSLEMSKEQLVNRMLSSEVMVDSQKMRTGAMDAEDWEKLGRAMGPISDAPIYIDDTAGINVMEIRAKARRLKLERNLGLVIIDYLQLMQGTKRTENRQQEISEISRSLKIMAKEINVPVIALSQLSRGPESRSDHRPMLSDLRESGAIEQDADIVMFLYRDDYYNEESEKQNIAEVIVAKHRNGSTGTIELRWFGEYTKFGNLAKSK
jgi:replicative DNA helicase